jgi:hypothetical protein
MADLSDVENALLGYLNNAIYPSGPLQPANLGVDCRIYRGWPIPARLNADLTAGIINVTVNPDTTVGETTTRFFPVWYGSTPKSALSVAVNGVTATISGTANSGQVVGLIIDGRPYSYRTVVGDTPQLIAANLMAAVQADRTALLAGSSLSIPGAHTVLGRVVVDTPVSKEVRRQSHNLRIGCWCPTPVLRDQVCSLLDSTLAALPFIVTDDEASTRITYRGTQIFDQSQNALLYRRDMVYQVEYPTLSSQTAPAMLFGDLQFNAIHRIG